MGQQNIGNVIFLTSPAYGSELAKGTVAQNLPADRMQYPFSLPTNFGLPITGTPVSNIFQVGQPTNSGFITGAHASIWTPGSASSVVIDFLKNGVTICSVPITLTNASTAKAQYNATLSILTFNAGDVFTIQATVGSSTGMAGLFACLNGYETANPQ